jgi:hypothetical protein
MRAARRLKAAADLSRQSATGFAPGSPVTKSLNFPQLMAATGFDGLTGALGKTAQKFVKKFIKKF